MKKIQPLVWLTQKSTFYSLTIATFSWYSFQAGSGSWWEAPLATCFRFHLNRVRNPLPVLAREESQSLIKGVRGVTPWQQRVCGCRQGQWGQHPSLTHSRGWVKSRCTSTLDKRQHWEGQKAMFKTQGPVCAKHKSVKSPECVSRISDRPLVCRVNPVPAVSFEKATAVGKPSSGRSGFVCYWLFKQTDP